MISATTILLFFPILPILIKITLSPDPTAETVVQIKFVAYGVIAYIIVGVGIVGNVLSLVVLTRPNLKVVTDYVMIDGSNEQGNDIINGFQKRGHT